MTRSCESCGKPFEAKRSTAKYCRSGCRVRATRKRASEPAEVVELGPSEPAVDESPLVKAVRLELEAAGRLESSLGQQALELARHMASPFDTGSARASVSRELRAVMDAALADAPKAADALDELALRRRDKASSA